MPINTGEGFFAKPDPAEETKHLCSILAQLDLYPLVHTQFLQQYRELSGNEDIVLKALIAPEIERLAEYLPNPLHSYSSDPSGVNTRFAIFEKLLAHDPNNPDLFGILAAIFNRQDQSENYDQLCQQIIDLGEYTRPRSRKSSPTPISSPMNCAGRSATKAVGSWQRSEYQKTNSSVKFLRYKRPELLCRSRYDKALPFTY